MRKTPGQKFLSRCFYENFEKRITYRGMDRFVANGPHIILDTTLRDLPLTEEQMTEAFNEICKLDKNDDVVFTVKSIAPIRKGLLRE